ncbi:hypothetical protein [uncultured Pontibacter sp.]|uniref:hypothetical protein n=1 Tax=uncultured Pontibacter sp. TaxID=453356 RepID=UPI002622BD05|nr:hypothetical protein [uncultured Pontibacter sp.]
MLFIHLSSLAFVSFLPGANAGVAIKKVCLRQQDQTKVSLSHTSTVDFKRLLAIETDGAEKPDSEAEIRLCNVKLFCTPASTSAAFNHSHSPYQEPGYMAVAYYSQTTPIEPDPPRFS